MPDRTQFRVTCPIQLRFRDTDALGHINNAVYLSYLELARVAYWRKLFKVREIADINFILARVEIDYRLPATMGDDLVIGIRCPEMRGASFDVVYEIWEKGKGRTIATAKTIQVAYDFKKGKPIRLPSAYREKILAFENLSG